MALAPLIKSANRDSLQKSQHKSNAFSVYTPSVKLLRGLTSLQGLYVVYVGGFTVIKVNPHAVAGSYLICQPNLISVMEMHVLNSNF